jgi:hypothetical protein
MYNEKIVIYLFAYFSFMLTGSEFGGGASLKMNNLTDFTSCLLKK